MATSTSAAGPYTILHEQVNVSNALNGDFNMFEDDDGKGYIVCKHAMRLPLKWDHLRIV